MNMNKEMKFTNENNEKLYLKFTTIPRPGEVLKVFNDVLPKEIDMKKLGEILEDGYKNAENEEGGQSLYIFPASKNPKQKKASFMVNEQGILFTCILVQNTSKYNKKRWFGLRAEVYNKQVKGKSKLAFDDQNSENEFLDGLAHKAVFENWEWNPEIVRYKSKVSKPILLNYLIYTYERLLEEDKIRRQSDYVFFNSGLLSRLSKDVIIRGKICGNKLQKKPCIGNLEVGGSEKWGKICENLPLASYFRKDCKGQYIPPYFYPDIKVEAKTEHIIQDGLKNDRFPSFKDEYYKIDKKHRDNENGADYDNLVAKLVDKIKVSIDRAIDMAKRNYRLAVPQYYNGEIQFLLPLYFEPTDPNPECVLTIQETVNDETQSREYVGRTVLTLDMAYNNSRLLAKPDEYWIRMVSKGEDDTKFKINYAEGISAEKRSKLEDYIKTNGVQCNNIVVIDDIKYNFFVDINREKKIVLNVGELSYNNK